MVPASGGVHRLAEISCCGRHLLDWSQRQGKLGGDGGVPMADSSTMVRSYCPGCESEADPIREVLIVRWCDEHAPKLAGSDDATVRFEGDRSVNTEAGGDSNRHWCHLLHRSTAN